MSKKQGKNVPPPKVIEYPFPEREALEKPEKSPEEIYQEINGNLEIEIDKYLTVEERERISANFKLFDRDFDTYIDLEELEEALISVNYKIKNKNFITQFYNLYKKHNITNNKVGVQEDEFFILIISQKKDENVKDYITTAFENLFEDNNINSEKFRELLMYNGYKYDENQVNLFMSAADPKNTGTFDFKLFTDKISDTTIKKKKKAKKAKK